MNILQVAGSFWYKGKNSSVLPCGVALVVLQACATISAPQSGAESSPTTYASAVSETIDCVLGKAPSIAELDATVLRCTQLGSQFDNYYVGYTSGLGVRETDERRLMALESIRPMIREAALVKLNP